MRSICVAIIALFVLLIPSAVCFAAESDENSGNASDFIPSADVRQTIYFWDEGNMPSETSYTEDDPAYSDPPDFRPYMTFIPAAEGGEIKGAVMICPGGAFEYRSPAEGTPVAEALSRYGYQCFVVNYRLRPYTQEEAALDLARGVRFVRRHADVYGIDPNDIAVMGFSAGGILSGELALNFGGTANGSVLDAGYTPDALDDVSADPAAVGLMYSFYGRLSVASTDVEEFRRANLPPTYVLYGSEEIFRGQIENQVGLLREAGVSVESHILEGYRHGFGANGNWFGDYDRFLTEVFAENGEPAPDDTELLSVAEPSVDGNELRYSITANRDVSNAIVAAALYDDGMLKDIRVGALDGSFSIEEGRTYRLKIFAWERNTLRPLMESKSFDGLRSGSTGELQVMLNNILESSDGDIHYTYYLPESYDENKSYPMLLTLPGYSARFNTIKTTPLTENDYALRNAETWTRLAGDMIVVSPSLTDWGDRSARQTIALTDYFIENFAVDTDRIYAAGFSAGGETLSRAINMRPELFAAYLHASSQWDGGYEAAAERRLPVYICMALGDEYYGSDTARAAYNGLREAYLAAGISEEETDELVILDLKDDSYFEGRLTGNYHGSGGLFANDDEIVSWALSHSKSAA